MIEYLVCCHHIHRKWWKSEWIPKRIQYLSPAKVWIPVLELCVPDHHDIDQVTVPLAMPFQQQLQHIAPKYTAMPGQRWFYRLLASTQSPPDWCVRPIHDLLPVQCTTTNWEIENSVVEEQKMNVSFNVCCSQLLWHRNVLISIDRKCIHNNFICVKFTIRN